MANEVNVRYRFTIEGASAADDLIAKQKEIATATEESTKRQKKSFDDLASASQKANRHYLETFKVTQEVTNSSREFQKETERLIRTLQSLEGKRTAFAATGQLRELEAKIKEVRSRIQELGGDMSKIPGKVSSVVKEEAAVVGIINTLIQKERELVKARNASNDPTQIANFRTQIEQNRAELRKFTGEAQNSGAALTDYFMRLTRGLGAMFALDRLLAFAGATVDAASKIEGVRDALILASNSAEEGQANFEFLKNTTNELGLELEGAANGYKNILAAAKGTPLVTEQINRLFRSVAVTSSVMKLSASDTEGVLRALAQMMSKGTVQAEELRGQLGERLPGAFNLAAEAMGVTTQELGKMMERGELVTAEFIPKFTEALEKKFVPGLQKSAESLRAAENRIKNFWTVIKQAIGENFTGPIVIAFSKLVSLVDGFGNANERAAAQSWNTIRVNQQAAKSAESLANQYDLLSGKINPTTEDKKKLDIITLKLRDTLGESVVAINSETGALELNREEVKKQISQRLLLANTEALGQAQRAQALKDEIEAANLRQKTADREIEVRKAIVKSLGLNDQDILRVRAAAIAKEAERGKDAFLATVDATREQIAAVKDLSNAEMAGAKITDEILRKAAERNKILAELKRLGFSPQDIDRLYGSEEQVQQLEKQIGLIARLRKEIKDLAEAREKILELPGREEAAGAIDFYNKELIKKQKELDDLLGKVKKGGRDRDRSAMEAYLRLLRKLEGEADKARIEAVKKSGAEYIQALLDQSNKEIDALEKDLIKKKRLAGLGSQLGKEQIAQLNLLREDAIRAAGQATFRLIQEEEEQIFQLREESNEKEIKAVERKYDALILAADKNEAIITALIAARNREQFTLRLRQAQERIELEERIGLDIVSAMEPPERKGSMFDEVEFERQKQAQILEIRAGSAREQLKLLEGLNDDQSRVERAYFQRILSETETARKELKRQSEQFSMAKLFKVTDSELAEMSQSLGVIAGQWQALVNEQKRLADERVSILEKSLDTRLRMLEIEIEANKQGFASNVEGERENIEQLKQLRREAIEDQRKAQRQQEAINALQQASAIMTAGANVIQGWSTVPLAGSILGIAAVAAMIAGFVAMKQKVNAQVQERMYYEGGYTGDGNPREEAGKVHKKEFVNTAKTTAENREFLEALHVGKLGRLNDNNPTIKRIMSEVKFTANPDMPEITSKIRLENNAANRMDISPLQTEMRAMNQRLAHIESSNASMEKQPVSYESGSNFILKKGNVRYITPKQK